MTTLVDTDVLLALVHPKDLLHDRAVVLAKQLATQQTTLFLLPTTLGEFATLASLRMSFDQSKRMVEVILSQNYVFIDVTGDMVREANLRYGISVQKETPCLTVSLWLLHESRGLIASFPLIKAILKMALSLPKHTPAPTSR